MKGDFESEREKLGDLPSELLRERGETSLFNDRLGGVPPDMARSADVREAAAKAGIGGPVLDYTVRGIFDSRPVNGIDFNLSYGLTLVDEGTGFGSVPAMFQVPPGRVLVVRNVAFSDIGQVTTFDSSWTFPNAGADNLQLIDMYVQLLKNGGVVQPVNMRVPGDVGFNYKDGLPIKGGDAFDTFLIFDEGEQIGMNFYFVPGGDLGSLFVNFYGNILLKTGVPANFEVANKGAGTPSRVVASQRDLMSTPSLADRAGARTGARTATNEIIGQPPNRRFPK